MQQQQVEPPEGPPVAKMAVDESRVLDEMATLLSGEELDGEDGVTPPSPVAFVRSVAARKLGMRVVVRSGAILLAFSWEMCCLYALFELQQRGKRCEPKKANEAPPVHAATPEQCLPTRVVLAGHFAYAFVALIVSVFAVRRLTAVIERLQATESTPEQRARRAHVVLFLDVCIVALGLLPAWALVTAIMNLSTLLVGPSGGLIFAVLVTVVNGFLLFASSRMSDAFLERHTLLDAQSKALLAAVGLSTSAAWVNSVAFLFSYLKTGGAELGALAGFATLTTAVTAFVRGQIDFTPPDAPRPSRLRQQFEFLVDEALSGLCVIPWINAVQEALIVAFSRPDPPAWAWAAFAGVTTLCAFFSVDWLSSKEESEHHGRMRKQTAHFVSATLGVIVGWGWAHVGRALFLEITQESTGILVYCTYMVVVTMVFFMAVWFATNSLARKIVANVLTLGHGVATSIRRVI